MIWPLFSSTQLNQIECDCRLLQRSFIWLPWRWLVATWPNEGCALWPNEGWIPSGNFNLSFGTKTTNFKISLTRFRFASLVLAPTSITVTALAKTPLSNIAPITYPNCHWFPLYCWVLEEQYHKHKLFFSFCSIFVSVGNCSKIPSSMATKSHLWVAKLVSIGVDYIYLID